MASAALVFAMAYIALPSPAAVGAEHPEPKFPPRPAGDRTFLPRPRALAPRNNVPFVLKHFTKAGGTFTRLLLQSVLPKQNFHYVSDDASLGVFKNERAALGQWRAVTMRNVCDLYISYAHFHPNKAFTYGGTSGAWPFPPAMKMPPGWFKVGFPYRNKRSPSIEPDTMYKFIEAVRRPGSLQGFQSWSMWNQVVNNKCFWTLHKQKPWDKTDPTSDIRRAECGDEDNATAWAAWNHLKDWGALHAEAEAKRGTHSPPVNLTRGMQEMKSFDPIEAADCWLFQETLMGDLRSCLEAYETSMAHVGHGIVNWTQFDLVESSDEARHKLLGAQYAKKDASIRRHEGCEHYFPPGGKLERLVREADPDMFERFGYAGCCAPSNHQSILGV